MNKIPLQSIWHNIPNKLCNFNPFYFICYATWLNNKILASRADFPRFLFGEKIWVFHQISLPQICRIHSGAPSLTPPLISKCINLNSFHLKVYILIFGSLLVSATFFFFYQYKLWIFTIYHHYLLAFSAIYPSLLTIEPPQKLLLAVLLMAFQAIYRPIKRALKGNRLLKVQITSQHWFTVLRFALGY